MPLVTAAVLLAAVTHASWNALAFSRRLYAQRVTPDRHLLLLLLLDGTLLTETRADGTVTERGLTQDVEVRKVLAEDFDIDVPDDCPNPLP
ncbi:hypothetical protein ABZ092_10415 [Streptomyces bobili]|uniref:hypothetical protein n=1 Tax=Streptomyces bobili TaxID=67280 RepID=UPI0033BF86BF